MQWGRVDEKRGAVETRKCTQVLYTHTLTHTLTDIVQGHMNADMQRRLPSRTNAAGVAESKMKRLYEADVQLLSAIADTARKKEMECSMAGCQVQTKTCMCLCIHLS